MAKDLTASPLERQNILNNRYALEKLEEHLGLGGIFYEGEVLFTKQQLVEVFGISESTVEKYLASHTDELSANGYTVLRGRKLREFKALVDGTVIDYGTKTSVLGVFTFRATLNLAMVLVESDRAREIRSRILDIVIDVMAERAGGHTKFINQQDSNNVRARYADISACKSLDSRPVQTVLSDGDLAEFLDQCWVSLQEQFLEPEMMAVFRRLAQR